MTRAFLRPKRFRLGTFATNCSGGMSVTTSPGRWRATWSDNLALARMLDEAGIDFMLPIARWIGYGGETDFHGSVLDPIAWAGGLLASTQRLTVFSTIHTAANHPVVIAKQISTLDHISNGRAGLNVVAGWNEPEYRALGLDLPGDHETRYRYAGEWMAVIRRLWTADAPFDWDGEFFRLAGVYSKPVPVDAPPPVLNAAGSQQGRGFAVGNADFLFTPAIDLARSRSEIEALKQQAHAIGRQVEVLTFSHVVCRGTHAEANEALAAYTGAATDEGALDTLMRLQFAHAQSFPHDLLRDIRDLMAMGHGGFPLIGTPDQVAAGIIALAEAGFGGTTLSFLDYRAEFPLFRDEVLPRLRAAGLWTPVAEPAAA